MIDSVDQLYDDFTALLDLNQSEASASFIQGRWVGWLCAPTPVDVSELLSADLLWQRADDVIDRLFIQETLEWTLQGLRDPLLSFQLLLPAMDLPLVERAGALVQWLEGFFHGLGESGVREADMTAESRELLQDLLQISQLETQMAEDETCEKQLFELQEYTRVAVMSLFEQFSASPVKSSEKQVGLAQGDENDFA